MIQVPPGQVGWLRQEPVSSALPDEAVIVEYGRAKRMWSPEDDTESAEVVVAATAFSGASNRDNTRENKTIIAEVEVAAEYEWVDENSTKPLRELLDAIEDALTTHHAGRWNAQGLSGGTDALIPQPDIGRYAGVVRADFSRDDTHQTHT